MEIERLPLGQSLADKHRVAELKWRGKPPGIPPEMAVDFMAKLRAGSTVRKLTAGGKILGPAMVSFDRFKKHCKLDPVWAAEALRISDANSRLLKGVHLRNKAHCANGHSFAEHGRVAIHKGYWERQCRACETMRYRQGGVMRPEVLEKVAARIRAGSSLSSFTKAGSGNTGYLVRFSTLARYRRENPEFNSLVVEATRFSNSKAQRLRWDRIRNNVVRSQNNDFYKIRAMLPANFPDKDDVVSAIFEDLLAGALKLVDVRTRVQKYITAHNRMFPTKFAKFGDARLVSLDEVLFEDGSATRGDTVSRGLWD